jgi:hypothetical protein
MFTPHRRTSRVSEDVLDSLKHKLIRKILQVACLGLSGNRASRGFLLQCAVQFCPYSADPVPGAVKTERSRVSLLLCARLEIRRHTAVR